MKTAGSQPLSAHAVRNSSEVPSVMLSGSQCAECTQNSHSEPSELQLGRILTPSSLSPPSFCQAKAPGTKMLSQNVAFPAKLW